MRRVVYVVLLVAIPLLAALPGAVRAGTHAPAAHRPVKEQSPTACSKKGQKKTTKCKPPASRKPTATPIPKKKSKPKKTPTPVRRATPRPTRTPVPTPTATFTPSPTATITLTPTPEPATAQLAVRSTAPAQYLVAFVVCGLPSGVTATFSPNPVVALPDPSIPSSALAQSMLTISVPWTTLNSDYGLEIFALYQDRQGITASAPPGANVTPHSAILHVDTGSARLSAADAVPATGYQGCSSVPTTFHPLPQATLSPGQIAVTSSVSNPHPAAGESMTATGQILGNNQGLYNIPVHFAFFGPRGMPGCDTTTDYAGRATCTWVNTNPLPGYKVLIQVTFDYGGREYTSYTSYTM